MFQLSRTFDLVYNTPWNFVKTHFVYPFVLRVHSHFNSYKETATRGVYNIRNWLIRSTIVLFCISLLFSLSILMYIAFYIAYVPPISHTIPIYFTFRSCDLKTNCSDRYPLAKVAFVDEKLHLMLGQPYKITIELEMPESSANKDLGMFMICAYFYNKHLHAQNIQNHSCRSSMLHYQSDLLHFLKITLLSPLFLIGSLEEKQIISVDLFSNYIQNDNEPANVLEIEIQSKTIEFYSANLRINAHFTGLRYFMFHWPLISSIVGIFTNLMFTTMFALISWYQLIHSEEYNNYRLSHIEVAENLALDKHECDELLVVLDDNSQDSKNDALQIIETPDSTEC